jgi:hypothetical protein
MPQLISQREPHRRAALTARLTHLLVRPDWVTSALGDGPSVDVARSEPIVALVGVFGSLRRDSGELGTNLESQTSSLIFNGPD